MTAKRIPNLAQRNQQRKQGMSIDTEKGRYVKLTSLSTPVRVKIGSVYARPSTLKVQAPKDVLNIIGAYVSSFKHFDGWGEMPLTPMSIEIIYEKVGGSVQLEPEVVEWMKNEITARRLLHAHLSGIQTFAHESLYSFQKTGVSFMSGTAAFPCNREGIRVLQCDDPRLGKTIQTAVAVLSSQENLPAVVFCLKSLIDYWIAQIQLWTPTVQVIKLDGSVDERLGEMSERLEAGEHCVMITNWAVLRKIKQVPRKTRNKIVTVIGDEAHVVRNRKAQVTEGLHTLRPRNAVLLTATPLERGPQEYFSYLKFLRPWEFNSYWRYLGWFCDTEYNGFGQSVVGTRNIELLKDLLYPMMLRRKAEDVADVPPKTFETIPITPSEEFEHVYDHTRRGVLDQLFDETEHERRLHPNALQILTQLRQLSVDPSLLDLDLESPKLEVLHDLVEERFSEERVVVFCSFNDTLKALAAKFTPCSIFFSGDPQEIEDFNDPNNTIRVFFTTPQKGGVGQNLGASSIIIYYDLPLSSTLLRQSMERTTLIGKQEPQLIISLAATPTDYAVASLLERKLETVSDVDILTEVIASEKSDAKFAQELRESLE